MFWSKNKKKEYPCKPQFYYIKVGCKGVFVTRTCFRDVLYQDSHYANMPMQYAAKTKKYCLIFQNLCFIGLLFSNKKNAFVSLINSERKLLCIQIKKGKSKNCSRMDHRNEQMKEGGSLGIGIQGYTLLLFFVFSYFCFEGKSSPQNQNGK